MRWHLRSMARFFLSPVYWRLRRRTRHEILVTGASGFVGRALCAALLQRGDAVRGAVRTVQAGLDGVEQAEGRFN